jgi:hypothetical protein
MIFKLVKERALLYLAQVASADLCLVRELILRQPLGMAQTAKIGTEHLSQVHTRSVTVRPKYSPRYTEQSVVWHKQVNAGVRDLRPAAARTSADHQDT